MLKSFQQLVLRIFTIEVTLEHSKVTNCSSQKKIKSAFLTSFYNQFLIVNTVVGGSNNQV